MSTIVLRSVKGTPLSNSEVDANFSNLNTDKIEIGGTYSSGTANGMLFLSSSKVLTTGSALTFDGTNFGVGTASPGAKLDVVQAGTATVAALGKTNVAQFLLGFNGTSNNYLDGDNNIFRSGNGTEGMRLTSTGLGIGNSSPTAKLDVTGTAAISGAVTLSGGTANGVAYLNGSKVLTTGSALTFDGTNLAINGAIVSGAGLTIANDASAPATVKASFSTGSTERGFISMTGGTGEMRINAGYSGYGGFTTFYTEGSEQMRLTSTGLGIGTSSPGAKLDVNGGANSEMRVTTSGSGYLQVGQFTNGAFIGTSSTDPTAGILRFGTGGTERMRLDASGNLGLGVTPTTGGYGKGFQFSGDPASDLGTLWIQPINTNDHRVSLTNNAKNIGVGTWAYNANSQSATMYEQVAGVHRFFTAGTGTAGDAISFTQAMTLDASGNLLLGTTSGNGLKLDFSPTASQKNGITYTQTSPDTFTDIYGAGTSGGWNGAIRFFTSASAAAAERLRIDSSGNLGLGVTPSAWNGTYYRAFQIANNGASLSAWTSSLSSSKILHLTNNGYQTYSGITGPEWRYATDGTSALYKQSSSQHEWYTAPSGTAGNAISFTQAMTLDASGNLGVGGTALSARIHSQVTDGVYPFAASGTTKGIRFETNSSNARIVGVDNTLNGSYQPLMLGGSELLFASDGVTERARIDSSGNLLVGKTSAGNYTNGAQIYANGETIGLGHASTTGSGAAYLLFGYDNGGIGSITQSGTTAVAYNTSSDYRLKNITGPITTSGAYIDSLNPVEGTWKADGSTFVGLIAHEVQEASRTNVATGVKDGEQMQGMDYSSAEIIANLIAEVKALRTRVAALEAA
jgi:hypothetical protein